jgi:hypothetical protein
MKLIWMYRPKRRSGKRLSPHLVFWSDAVAFVLVAGVMLLRHVI